MDETLRAIQEADRFPVTQMLEVRSQPGSVFLSYVSISFFLTRFSLPASVTVTPLPFLNLVVGAPQMRPPCVYRRQCHFLYQRLR